MYQCPKCKGWIAPHDDTYSHACSGTLAKMRDKVAEHKALQDDHDYQLAKAAFTVLRELKPEHGDPAFQRAYHYQYKVYCNNFAAWNRACVDGFNLTPSRRCQDKKEQPK